MRVIEARAEEVEAVGDAVDPVEHLVEEEAVSKTRVDSKAVRAAEEVSKNRAVKSGAHSLISDSKNAYEA